VNVENQAGPQPEATEGADATTAGAGTGRYALLEEIGSGGMGRVWRARDEVLARDVAIKEIVLPAWMSDAERTEAQVRARREARAAAQLNHPNVVQIYDFVPTGGAPWIVMEYIAGRSLHEVIVQNGPLRPEAAARLGLRVLSALAAAHRARVLHRDVKPENVLIAADGRVVLSDFGLAVIQGGDADATRSGPILASPQYVAPERARDGVSTVEGDLWSFGATLYAAVEGRSPYARSSAMATLTALATEPPAPPKRAGALAAVLDGLLRKEPAERMTAEEAMRLLTPLAGGTARSRPVRMGASGPIVGVARVRPPEAPLPLPVPEEGEPALVARPTRKAARAARRAGRGERAPVGATRRRRGGLRSLVLLAVLGLAGATGSAVAADARSAGRDNPPEPPGLASSVMSAGPCVGPAPSAAPVQGGEVGPYPLPEGWVWHRDEAGFQLGVPADWSRHAQDGAVCFRDPDGRRTLAVDTSATPTGEPAAVWESEERRLLDAAALPGYSKISIMAVLFRLGGADWEYTWKPSGKPRLHTLRRLFATSPTQAYKVTWTTPDRDWAGNESTFRTITTSFRPLDPR
jgi:hypothetical protein